MTALLSALSERGIDVGYAAAWRTVRTLPEPAAKAVFARAADLAYRRDGRSVKQLRRNLVRVLPADHHAAELEAVVRRRHSPKEPNTWTPQWPRARARSSRCRTAATGT
jgi:lauroyl/myristoyl acyltransferase